MMLRNVFNSFELNFINCVFSTDFSSNVNTPSTEQNVALFVQLFDANDNEGNNDPLI